MIKSKIDSLLYSHSKNGSIAKNFESDYIRFKSVDKLLTRYRKTNETNGRLLVNHCVILFNLFAMTAYEGFELEVHEDNYELLGSVLVYMQRVTNNSLHDLMFLEYLESL